MDVAKEEEGEKKEEEKEEEKEKPEFEEYEIPGVGKEKADQDKKDLKKIS